METLGASGTSSIRSSIGGAALGASSTMIACLGSWRLVSLDLEIEVRRPGLHQPPELLPAGSAQAPPRSSSNHADRRIGFGLGLLRHWPGGEATSSACTCAGGESGDAGVVICAMWVSVGIRPRHSRSSGCRRQGLGLCLRHRQNKRLYARRSGSVLSIVRPARPESGGPQAPCRRRCRSRSSTHACSRPARAVGMGCAQQRNDVMRGDCWRLGLCR